MTPRVSVVMAAYNAELYIKEAIESVLRQTFGDFELIIIDDGSSDSTAAIIESYADTRISLIRGPKNTGLAKSLNVGIGASKFALIARMDADDVSLPQRFERQIEFLSLRPECAAVGSNAYIVDKDGEYICSSKLPCTWEEIREILPRNPFYHSSVMFRKDAFLQAGGYAEAVRHHIEDVILWIRLSSHGQLRNIEEPLIKYRMVPTGLSNRSAQVDRTLNLIAQKYAESGALGTEDMIFLEALNKPKSSRWLKSNYHRHVAKFRHLNGREKSGTLRSLAKSICIDPFNWRAWGYVPLVLLGLRRETLDMVPRS